MVKWHNFNQNPIIYGVKLVIVRKFDGKKMKENFDCGFVGL